MNNNYLTETPEGLKKFDVTEALNGAKVVTRLGFKVNVHCVSRGKVFCTIIKTPSSYINKEKAYQIKVNLDGSRYAATSPHFEDLFLKAM